MSTWAPDEALSFYTWEVVYDPTPERAFQGGRFRLIDLTTGARMRTWPEGMRWRNVKTGASACYRNGRLEIERNAAGRERKEGRVARRVRSGET